VDTFPFDSWEEAIAAATESGAGYFTFGPGGNTATYILTVVGLVVTVIVLVAFVRNEDRRLESHARRLSGGENNGR
jgi:hypothetical protein